jgi:hypothetical protein
MRFGWQWAVLAGALSLAPVATFAASSCYEPSSYPAVLRIEAAEGGFRAYTASPDLEKAMRLALELRKRHGWRPDDPGPAYVHPVIGYSKQNGFVQLGDDLWVATDLGLSNWNRKTSKWKNYAPDPSSRLPMRETSCPDLYRHLIDTLPRSGWNEAMPAKSPYHQLIETLARLRPRAIDAATLADGLFHVFFADGIAFNPEPGERAYRSEDFAAAFQEIKQRAEKGELQAQYNLGTLYALGKGVGRDFAQAATLARQGRRAGPCASPGQPRTAASERCPHQGAVAGSGAMAAQSLRSGQQLRQNGSSSHAAFQDAGVLERLSAPGRCDPD